MIKAEDPIALQTSDGQTLKITGMIKRPKIEATSKFEKETIFQIHIAENESQALAAAQESANQRAAEQYEKQKAREARNNAILNGIEQMKIDARNEQIQQAQEAQRIKAEQEAAREEAAKQAEAQRQLDEFRNAEAEAKRQRDEQAAQEAERQRQAALAVPPQLLSPAPNAVMNNGCYNNSAYVTRTYSWTAVPSATLYQLFVKHPNGRAPNLDVQVSDTTYKERSNSYAPESSRFGITWKVRAMINGQWGAWSEERAFNYEHVNTNPACRQ